MVNRLLTPKQRMLDAYSGVIHERPPVAPEFWLYYPARFYHTDLITFEREIPFHLALKDVFSYYGCEGWGAYFFDLENPDGSVTKLARWVDDETLEERQTIKYGGREFHQAIRYSKSNPSWLIEAPVKDVANDLLPWMDYMLGKAPETLNTVNAAKAFHEVGESYLLEAWLGVPFFDFYANNRHGTFEAAIYDFFDPELESTLIQLRERYERHLTDLIHHVALTCDFESFVIGCSYSCSSMLGTPLWQKWDKPLLKNIVKEIHAQGKLVHMHFHGKSMDVLEDLVDIGVDCVCPFEQPPGGDVNGLEGLKDVMKRLDGKITFNGNVHTVETLIRADEAKVREDVRGIIHAAMETGTCNRLIIGSGDQIGQETPDENIIAMIEEGSKPWMKK